MKKAILLSCVLLLGIAMNKPLKAGNINSLVYIVDDGRVDIVKPLSIYYIVDQSSRPALIDNSFVAINNISWSPLGEKIALVGCRETKESIKATNEFLKKHKMDTRHAFNNGEYQIYLYDLAKHEMRQTTLYINGGQEYYDYNILPFVFNPDGNKIVYEHFVKNKKGAMPRLYLLDLISMEKTHLLSPSAYRSIGRDIFWIKSDNKLVVRDADNICSYDFGTGAWSTEYHHILWYVEGYKRVIDNKIDIDNINRFSCSPDASIMVLYGSNSAVSIYKGTDRKQFDQIMHYKISLIEWSRDGKSFAFTGSKAKEDNNYGLYYVNVSDTTMFDKPKLIYQNKYYYPHFTFVNDSCIVYEKIIKRGDTGLYINNVYTGVDNSFIKGHYKSVIPIGFYK